MFSTSSSYVGYIIEGIGLVFTDREGHEVNA